MCRGTDASIGSPLGQAKRQTSLLTDMAEVHWHWATSHLHLQCAAVAVTCAQM